jgi:hypothetical protein
VARALSALRTHNASIASPRSPGELVGVMRDVLALRMNLLLTQNCGRLHEMGSLTHGRPNIDVWTVGAAGSFCGPAGRATGVFERSPRRGGIGVSGLAVSGLAVSEGAGRRFVPMTGRAGGRGSPGGRLREPASGGSPLSSSGTLSLQLQLAHILQRTTEGSRMRFLAVVPGPEHIAPAERSMARALEELRIDASVAAVPLVPSHDENAEAAARCAAVLARHGGPLRLDEGCLSAVNHLVRRHSWDSRVTILALPADGLEGPLSAVGRAGGGDVAHGPVARSSRPDPRGVSTGGGIAAAATAGVESPGVQSSDGALDRGPSAAEASAAAYVRRLRVLTAALPPTIMATTSKRRSELVSTEI